MLFFHKPCQMQFSWLHFRSVALKVASDKGKNAKSWIPSSKSQSLWLLLSVTLRHQELCASLDPSRDFFSPVYYVQIVHMTMELHQKLCINLCGIYCLSKQQTSRFFPNLLQEIHISLTWLLFMPTQKVRTSSLKEHPHFNNEVCLLMSIRHCWNLKK